MACLCTFGDCRELAETECSCIGNNRFCSNHYTSHQQIIREQGLKCDQSENIRDQVSSKFKAYKVLIEQLNQQSCEILAAGSRMHSEVEKCVNYFLNEVDILKNTNHQNIIKLYEIKNSQKNFYLINYPNTYVGPESLNKETSEAGTKLK